MGARGAAVRALQRALGGLAVDGVFGSVTRDQVVALQRRRRLPADRRGDSGGVGRARGAGQFPSSASARPCLRVGDSGLRSRRSSGCSASEITGVFDERTREAVKEAQARAAWRARASSPRAPGHFRPALRLAARRGGDAAGPPHNLPDELWWQFAASSSAAIRSRRSRPGASETELERDALAPSRRSSASLSSPADSRIATTEPSAAQALRLWPAAPAERPSTAIRGWSPTRTWHHEIGVGGVASVLELRREVPALGSAIGENWSPWVDSSFASSTAPPAAAAPGALAPGRAGRPAWRHRHGRRRPAGRS